MTCEICGKSQMNVMTMRLAGNHYEFCTQCSREVDDLARFFEENFRKALLEMIKFPGGIART